MSKKVTKKFGIEKKPGLYWVKNRAIGADSQSF